jgi:hypothetical protein
VLTGDHLGRRDERASLGLARAGRFRLDLDWNRTPHLLYRDAAMIFSGDKGDYRIADAVRAGFGPWSRRPTPRPPQRCARRWRR